MRPDPYKKKASRRYWSKQRSKAGGDASSSTTDHNKPSEPQQHSGHTQPAPLGDKQESSSIQQISETVAENADIRQLDGSAISDSSEVIGCSSSEEKDVNEKSHVPFKSQFSRRKLQDNSWRYVEETEIDEEAMINARIAAIEEQKDLREIVSHIRAKKLDTTVYNDNVYVKPRAELAPMDSAERNRILDELNAEIIFDEFTHNPSSKPVENAVVRNEYTKIDIDELAPNVTRKMPVSTIQPSNSLENARKPSESDELDKLLDDLL
ncbi:hypothetical protein J3B02_000250 [Coemansia erecta]|nr:hypothetical protein J3B02_000250 [Coemansia erecta]